MELQISKDTISTVRMLIRDALREAERAGEVHREIYLQDAADELGIEI